MPHIPPDVQRPGLKDAWSHVFHVGAAVSPEVLSDPSSAAILCTHFSSLTPESAMKMASIQSEEGRWRFEDADSIADFARAHGQSLRGNTFVSPQHAPPWLFARDGERNEKNRLFSRLETHMAKVLPRYADVARAWDIVTETIDVEHGTPEGYRTSRWLEIGGLETYRFAFRTAHAIEPGARLFYNDYGIESGAKLDATLAFLKTLLDEGVPLHGVGIQGHWHWDYPEEDTLRTALEAYSALGLDIELTEVDLSAYSALERAPLFDTPPEERVEAQMRRYKSIFRIASDHPNVKGITTWGVADNHTWLDNFPVRGRKNWPLLFDLALKEKAAVPYLIDAGFALMD